MLRLLCSIVLAVCAATAAAADRDPLVLRGEIDGSDHQRYREVPFTVPAGTARITVAFDYDGREDKTTIDLGLLGPDGFRGWSGGNKREFTVSAYDATPSYLPGALPAGEWRLLLGIPNIRAGASASYTAEVRFTPTGAEERLPPSLRPVLAEQARWYRGDLHMHSAHSDASCDSQDGERVPCPLFLTLQAAAEQGLDFVALTDHNTVSHLHDIRGLQPYFDRLLLIPGMEVTTFQGHANVFGLRAPLDFRIGDTVPDWNALLGEVQARGLLLSVNHPALPSDERCMGCGWTPKGGVDWSRIAAVEVVNGADAGTPVSGIPFWHAQLDAGHRLAGVGGSDNHDAKLTQSQFGRSRVGAPVTAVHAASLSQDAILDGIRAGRVFVDVEGSRDRVLDLVARYRATEVAMGGVLALPAGAEANFELRLAGVADARVEVLVDGEVAPLLADPVVRDTGQPLRWRWRSDGGRHWLRVDVRDADGRLLLVGNPVYINF
ncbi:CehA/McbA family metallohydrolase [Luteimonas sp. R10]|uniref:CehA/McbA family metallohydrolase n=1 Tax=Luteimonas sp. R10 TaxID=3108176 RepID=UPI00308CC18F|nr:CehA/McbA family metallohydrolase [Luteimonas sp. R10]